jgi:hypothetical protein
LKCFGDVLDDTCSIPDDYISLAISAGLGKVRYEVGSGRGAIILILGTDPEAVFDTLTVPADSAVVLDTI